MKKRILAMLMTVIMVLTMVPAMAFAEDPEMTGVTLNTNDGSFVITFNDGNEITVSEDNAFEGTCQVGKTLKEGLDIESISEPAIDGDSSGFRGWDIYEPGAGADGEPLEISLEVSTVDLLDYVTPGHNLMIVARWTEEIENGNDGDGDGEVDWRLPISFAVSSNGGTMVVTDEMNDFNGEVDCYIGEFLSPGPVSDSVSFRISDIKKAGTELLGWTVYEADTMEFAHVEASVAEENGGCPPYGDPDLVFFLYDEYEENSVKMHTYIGLWNSELVDEAMPTEDLSNLGGNGKSYYAFPNWGKHEHFYNWKSVTEATCTKDGENVGICICGDTLTEIVKAPGHKYGAYEIVKAATCVNNGVKARTCLCGDKQTVTIKALGHKYGPYRTTSKASFGKEGVQTAKCTGNGCKAYVTRTIKAVATPKLSKTTFVFNNKAKKPAVKVSGLSNDYYKVQYVPNGKSVGKHSVKVTLQGANYAGYTVVYFKVKPAKPTNIKLTNATKKQFKVSWKKPNATYRNQIDGYQIKIAKTKAGLSKAKVKTYKGNKLTTKTMKSLKSKQRYWVQVRTYNKIGNTRYVSEWTTPKYIRTK